MLNPVSDPPTVLVIAIFLLLLVYGKVSLVVEPGPDKLLFSEGEPKLDSQERMKPNEKRAQQQEASSNRSFVPGKDQ